MKHATDCPFKFAPSSQGSDTIILIQKCPCGYVAPTWDASKGVSHK